MKDKKKVIEGAAIELAAERGAINLTRKEVCDKAGIPDGAFYAIMDETFPDFIGRLNLPVGAVVDRKRALPELRRKQVLDIAIELSKTKGYSLITRNDIATSANISPALVSHYFGTIENLRIIILKLAVKHKILEIIAQGLVKEDPIIIQAPKELKYAAVEYLAKL